MAPAPVDTTVRKLRWRLVLGEGSESTLGGVPAGEWEKRDRVLGFLYSREYGKGRNVRGGARAGSLADSQLTVPEWINDVHDLFPRKTIERLERDALERYQIQELVTNPELLQRATPSITLLKAVLHTRHLMNQEVLLKARDLVRKVVNDLLAKLAQPLQSPFYGVRDRRRQSFVKVARNFDARQTIRHNLKHYDPKTQRMYIQEPRFFTRVRTQTSRWDLAILVDQSGSMASSVIHSAVTASIFWGMRAVRTRLILFDTNVVDVTEDCRDPVETLMKVQLGGGTDIGNALGYAAGLVENPRRTIVILITDFCEGAPPARLLSTTHSLVTSGVKVLGLAALDDNADPAYDRNLAQQMVALGAEVGAMTPGELAAWVAEKVR